MKIPPSRNFVASVVLIAVLAAIFFYLHREESAPVRVGSSVAVVVKPSSVSGLSIPPPSDAASVAPPAQPETLEIASSVVLFHPPGQPTGTRIDSRGSQYLRASTAAASGRAAAVDRVSFARLGELKAGDAVSIPLMDGRIVTGRVNLIQRDRGAWIRAGGELADGGGSFTLSSSGTAASGLILLQKEKIAYQLEEQKDGHLWMLEKQLSEVICEPLPREPEGMARAPREGPEAAVPILDSRSGAADVIYLDFDGETVTDPYWNSGGTIVAPSFNLSAATISSIFDRVKEDWFPFNINVTTDVANYNKAALGHRMRVIITPNDAAAPGAGGVAYLTSFRNGTGGGNFTSNIPCWVFNSSIVGISEAISHEVGHTMGLSHDGRTSPVESYYLGHGSGATGWCPIMGAGYYKNCVQWSKGEYTNANNKEDDLAIISASNNHFGYMVDDAGNTRASANALSGNPANGSINQVGLIERTGDIDYYTFFTGTNGATITISAASPSSSPNLDIVLELQDATGATVGTVSNPPTALNASISATVPQAGQYYLKVSPTGAPTPPDTGFTNYASLGQYVLTGTVQGLTQNPIITSASTASGQVGVLFGYQIKATGNPASFGLQSPNDTLPPGLALDSTTGSISGYPTQAGTFLVTVTAVNASGTGTRNVTISIADSALTLGEAVDFPSLVWTTSPNAPWVGQKSVTKVDSDAAQAAQIGDGQVTSFGTTVTGPVTLDYQWKVSSEQDGDFLVLQVDGADVPDMAISGVVDWTAVNVQIGAGSHTVAWVYRKNAGISQDPDTAWVDGVSFSSANTPVIDSPANVNGTVGIPFSYQITATNVPWTFAIASGTLPLGLSLDIETGLISGVPAVAGTVTVFLTASNNIGASDPFAVQIQIAASSTTVAQALDDPTAGSYTLTTSQTGVNWFPETAVTHDSVDALQSGPIAPNQTVDFAKSITGFNTVNFWWKVESKPSTSGSFQGVRFYVDNVKMAEATGALDWENQSIPVSSGAHTLKWSYIRDNSGTLGADAAWVDQVVLTTDRLPVITSARPPDGTQGVAYSYKIVATNSPTSYSATGLPAGLSVTGDTISGVPTVSGNFDVTVNATNLAGSGTAQFLNVKFGPAPTQLKDGVDAPSLAWSTSAASPWFVETSVTFDGQDAAQSSPIAAGEISYVEAQVTGPTIVSFRWSVESEQAHDFLRFAIDGAKQAQITGAMITSAQPWELRSFSLEAGTHTLRWSYTKDAGGSFGRDAGWLDTVSVDSSTTKPKITSALTATAYLGRSFSYTIKATNGPTVFGATPLPGNLAFNTTAGVISGMPLVAGTTNIALTAGNGSGPGPASTLVLHVVPEPSGADSFTNASSLGGVSVQIEGSNAFATAESGEPAHGGQPAQSSIWYSWRAPLTGAVTITTAGSEIDTLLSVYETTPANAVPTFANILTPDRKSGLPKENDDAGRLITSLVKFNAIAGHTYLFAVDGLNHMTGKIVLNINYAASGIYSGLLTDNADTAAPGLATITLTQKLGFTGTILLGGKKIALKPIAPQKAVFTGEDFSGIVSRGNILPPLQVTLHLDLSPGAQEITGTVTGDGVTYSLFANLGIGKNDLPQSLPGPFTFLLEPDDTTTPGLPRGIGFGTATLDKSGNVKVAGSLGDGTKFSGGAHLAIDKSWILYLTPYKTGGGIIAGSVILKQVAYEDGATNPPTIKSVKSLSSNVSWLRGANASPVFNTTATLKGFQLNKDLPILTLNGVAATTLKVIFNGSDLAPKPADFTGTLDAAFKFTGGTNFTLKLTPKTGLFSGTLPDPAGGKAHPFGGAIINGIEFVSDNNGVVMQQPVSRGGGTFFGVERTGAIELKPIP